ncbi:MAG: DUF4390 domain-containing protein [Gammaproteobacteria bacterium]|jgi:hypothetical protein|nr:DUF4390 domain-containing protein [Gammaproteobacteria bacterium]MBU0773175.1 DUF4390 domain-containing protein [Gammaproteobacteria bacterium]MBU0855424.1 DUF4390 domain-containing protein [Gammaproteobacteria bacterium]MBU1848910.1 DUF4390 domain-containing protein [Gammaproteobacteria bacterium]
MMASTTHCCRSGPALTDALRALLCALLLALCAGHAAASGVVMRDVRLDHSDEGYQLTTDIAVTLSPRLAEAVTRGVALYFVLEFEISRPRWYWLDENVVERTQTYRLSYHALTRQYRVSTGALHQSFETLEDALKLVGRLYNWPVVEQDRLKAGESYVASLRLQLDVTQLPKPFQLSAMSNRDWTLESEWQRWGFTAQPRSPPQ